MIEKRCGADSLFRYTWPGRDEAFVCVEHAGGVGRVAEAMGLHVQMIMLLPEELAVAPTCSAIVREKP